MTTTRTLANAIWQAPRVFLAALVRFYRLFLSAWLGASCRFEPSCSAYALQALATRGAVVGTYLTLHRLVRCNPWCDGGHDPVPAAGSQRLFSSLSGLASLPDTPSAPSSSSEKNLS